MKLFIEKSRFRVGAGERKRLWWRTEQTICLYYQKIIRIRIDILCLRQAQAPRVAINITPVIERSRNHRDENKNVPSTGSGTESNTVIELVEITGRNKNLPSIGSGTESSSKYNTVIEESRNHQRNNIKRWLSGVEATTMKNLSYKSLKICYFFRKFRVSIK